MNPFPNMIRRAVAGAGLLAAACGAGGESSPDTEMTPSSQARQQACPLALAGTTSTAEDTVDGVVVAFKTTRAGDLPELRRRVDRLAEMHNSTQAGAPDALTTAPPQAPGATTTPEAAEDASGTKGASGAQSGGALDSAASSESGVDGVQLVLRPRDPARLDSMRDHLRRQADQLVKRACDQAGRKSLR